MTGSPSKPEQAKDADGGQASPGVAKTGPSAFFDRASTHNAIFYGLIGLCVLLFSSDLLYHKHGHFEFEHWLGFHGLFGFAAYLSIVNSAKLLRVFVKRSEDYYDR